MTKADHWEKEIWSVSDISNTDWHFYVVNFANINIDFNGNWVL